MKSLTVNCFSNFSTFSIAYMRMIDSAKYLPLVLIGGFWRISSDSNSSSGGGGEGHPFHRLSVSFCHNMRTVLRNVDHFTSSVPFNTLPTDGVPLVPDFPHQVVQFLLVCRQLSFVPHGLS